LAALLCLVQAQNEADKKSDADKFSLVWKFKPGQSREFSWSGEFSDEGTFGPNKVPKRQQENTVIGTVTIKEVADDGSGIGEVVLHDVRIKDLLHKEVDIQIENSILKHPSGPLKDENKKYVDSLLEPMKVKIDRRGTVALTGANPLIMTPGLWDLSLGPTLPWKKQVSVGDSWLGKLQSPEMKATDQPGFSVEYTFAEAVEMNGRKCAKLTMSSKQKIRFKGMNASLPMDASLSAKSEALFDYEEGVCILDSASGDVSTDTVYQGQKWITTAHFRQSFAYLPPKKQ
jgi:hypothetical protein